MGANPVLDFAGMIWENAIARLPFISLLRQDNTREIGDKDRLELGFGFGAGRSNIRDQSVRLHLSGLGGVRGWKSVRIEV